jgi:hypothetical protein
MNGQADYESEKLGTRSEWLERGIWFAGGLVVAGLLMEYGPELGVAFAKHELPKRGTAGGFLVTIGVAAEVMLGIFVAKTAKRLQVIAGTIIAQTGERAAKAEQAAAEANVERIRLERQMAGRDIPEERLDEIANRLRRFVGQRIIICSFPVNHETILFAGEIHRLLLQAGWVTERILPTQQSSPDGIYCAGFSLSSTPDAKSMEAGLALLMELGPLAGGGIGGGLGRLTPPEDPRIQLVVQERYLPPRSSVNAAR